MGHSLFLLAGILLAGLNNDAVPIDAYNAPCVVNTDDIIVYDSENLDKVNELIYNSDKIALNLLLSAKHVFVLNNTVFGERQAPS